MCDYPPPDFLGKLAYIPSGNPTCEDEDPETGIIFFLSVAVDKNVESEFDHCSHPSCSCDKRMIPSLKTMKGELISNDNLNVLLNMNTGSGASWQMSEAKAVKPLLRPLCFTA